MPWLMEWRSASFSWRLADVDAGDAQVADGALDPPIGDGRAQRSPGTLLGVDYEVI